MRKLRQVRMKRGFGSLDTGTAAPALEDDALVVARNVASDRRGSVTKRAGSTELARLAAHPKNAIASPVTNNGAVAGSTLTTGNVYTRITYSTVAGETDDYGSATTTTAVTAGDGLTAWVPFHIMNRTVASHETTSRTLKLLPDFSSTNLAAFANDTFNGYYLLCRNPAIQDETGLGVNPRNVKLYDRTNYLALIADYDGPTQTFTLDRELSFSLEGERIDILMPDFGGLPICAANVYVSQTAPVASTVQPFYFHSSVSGLSPTSVTVTSVTTSNRQAPSTRIMRVGTRVTVADTASTDPVSGQVISGNSGIEGGVWGFRHAWVTKSPTLLDTTGWPESSSFSLRRRERQSDQFFFPSRRWPAEVKDGQSITVSPYVPTGTIAPDGVTACAFFAKKLTPESTKTFAGISPPSATHRAYYFSGVVDPTIGTLSPSAFRAASGTAEYTITQYSYVGGSDVATTVLGDSTIATQKSQFEYQFAGAEATSFAQKCLVITIAPRRGASWTPVTPGSLTIRRWGGASWSTVLSIDPVSERVPRRLGMNFTASMLESGRLVFDVLGTEWVNYSISYAACETYPVQFTTDYSTDFALEADEFLQGVTTIDYGVVANSSGGAPVASAGTSLTFDKPLVTVAGNRIHANTTGQWPTTLFSWPIADTEDAEPQTEKLIVGAADSLFVLNDSTLQRVYRQTADDGQPDITTLEVCDHDWRFASFLTRVFACNPALKAGILRFDGVATFLAGLPDPVTAFEADEAPADVADEVDDCSQYRALEFWKPDPELLAAGKFRARSVATGEIDIDASLGKNPRWQVVDQTNTTHYIYDWRNINETTLGKIRKASGLGPDLVFEGPARLKYGGSKISSNKVFTDKTASIIACLAPGTSVTQGAPTGGTAETTTPPPQLSVEAGDFAWYVKYVRRVHRLGSPSYTARSAPVLISKLTLGAQSAVTLTVPQPPDPQATHLEFYRNITGTGSFLLVEAEPITEPDAAGTFSIVDSSPDDTLGQEIVFETGRPPAATLLAWAVNRLWLVAQSQQEILSFSNVVSEGGEVDPEGFYPTHTVEPPFPRLSKITALAPYEGTLLCHSDDGVIAFTGTSDKLNSADAIRSTTLVTDVGAISHAAWANADNVQGFMTRKGPRLAFGREVRSVSAKLLGTLDDLNWQNASTKLWKVAHGRDRGTSHLYFTYSDRGDGRPDKMFVFDTSASEGQQGGRREWSQWTEMYARGITRTKNMVGDEYVALGDHWGAILRHGNATSDRGTFIDAEVRTRPLDVSGVASMQLRFVYTFASGSPADFLLFDLYKDHGQAAVNPRTFRLRLGGRTASTWGDGTTWGQADVVWGETGGEGYIEQRASMGHVFRQPQLSYHQTWALMPPGTRRGASFEISGYDLLIGVLGPRDARSVA